MRKRIQQAKALHPYEIHHTKASGYFTNVDDLSQTTGKRKIRRCSEESLWNALAEWYLDNNNNLTLAELYDKWLDWKRTPKNQDNIKRIQASWKAYYLNEPNGQISRTTASTYVDRQLMRVSKNGQNQQQDIATFL